MAYPILVAQDGWYKSSTARSVITQINIVDSYTPTSYNETWNADVDNNGSIKCYIEGTILTIAGNGSGGIKLSADMRYMFCDFTSVNSINNIDLLDTSDVTNMTGMFQRAVNLNSLDLSKWNVSNVTNMAGMFTSQSHVGYMSLTSIGDVSGWNTSKVENMRIMFQCCSSLATLDVSKWDTSKVEDMTGMFNHCSSLTALDVSNWNTSKVENMAGMFQYCSSLATLDVSKWDTSSVTDMRNMFYDCIAITELDVATKKVNEGTANEYTAWDVSNVSDFQSMFSMGSYSSGSASRLLAELDVSGWDTSSATNMSFMFYAFRPQTRMVDLSNWDVSKVTTFDHMFAHSFLKIGDTSKWKVTTACTNLNALFLSVQNTTLDVSGFDTSNVTVFEQMFQGCTLLTEIIGLTNFDTSKGLGFSEMFQHCWKLKKLDLSSFDTTKAKDGAPASANNSVTNTLFRMFEDMRALETIILGPNFRFDGDGTCPNSAGVLPTPDSTYIPSADGNWYDAYGNAYAATDIPNGGGTYYASFDLIDAVYLIKRATLIKLANATRSLTGASGYMTLDEIISALEAGIGTTGGVNITFENCSVIDDGNGNITIE